MSTPNDSTIENTAPAIDVSAQYGSLVVSVNGMEIRTQDIVNMQINYEDIIKGQISFVDTLNVAEFSPLTYAIVNIKFTDALSSPVDLSFIIVNSEVIRIKSNKINIILTLEGLVSNALSVSYLSKAYSKVSFLDVVEDIFNTLDLPVNIYKNEGKIYDNFVVPGNISILEFLRKQSILNNVIMFSDRNGLSFANRDILAFSKLSGPNEYVFTLNRDDKYPYWNIIEYKGKVSNNKNTQRAPSANLTNHNILNLGYFSEKIDIESAYKTEKLNGAMGYGPKLTLPDLFVNNGTKQIDHLNVNEVIGDKEDYRSIINKQQELKIVVQGLNVLRVYSKIRIELPRSINVQTKVGDEVFSGLFVITKVVDKVVGGNFLQYLTLQSSDYEPGSTEIEAGV